MSYYSDVKSIIYGKPDKIAALVMHHRHTAEVCVFDEYGHLIDEWEHPTNGLAFIMLTVKEWNHYTFSELATAWSALANAAPRFGLAYEFIRIGENDDDAEVHRWRGEGDDPQEVEYILEWYRRVECAYEPPAEVETTTVPDAAEPALT